MDKCMVRRFIQMGVVGVCCNKMGAIVNQYLISINIPNHLELDLSRAIYGA